MEEDKQEKFVPSNLAGSYLKKSRVAQGITIEEASAKTRINQKSLEHLENGNMDDLPAFTYVKGFIRNYAKFLKLDEDKVLGLFQDEYQSVQSDQALKLANDFKSRKEDMKRNSRKKLSLPPLSPKLLLTLIPLILIGFCTYWYTQNQEVIAKFLNQSKESFSNKNESSTSPASSVKEEIIVEKTLTPTTLKITTPTTLALAQVTTTTTTNTTLAPTTTSTTLVENKDLSKTLPFIEFKKLRYPNYRISKDDHSFEIPDEFLHKSKSVKGLYITAERGDSWVRYMLPDRTIKSFMLKLGESKYIKGNSLFVILGNSSGLDLFYNNKKVLLSSKVYQILTFPRWLYKDHKEPLFIDTQDGRTLFYADYLKEMLPN